MRDFPRLSLFFFIFRLKNLHFPLKDLQFCVNIRAYTEEELAASKKFELGWVDIPSIFDLRSSVGFGFRFGNLRVSFS